jgi:amino acid adenylation domain-containing protein
MKNIDGLLIELRSRGIQLWLEGERLRYKAPKDALTADLLDRLKINKTEIISFLKDAAALTDSQLPPIVAIDRQAKLPLSFAQQRLWFLHQFEPNSSSSNMPVVVKITGTLDVACLELSITEVFNRHEVLRTTFPAVEGQPTAIIQPPSAIELPVIDLRQLADRDAEAFRLATQEACAPFNLADGPIMRVKLLWLNDTEYLFIWNLHCIICDGASSDIFYQDLIAVYSAFSEGKPSPLADLPIQYVDFAHWQRQWFQGEVLDSQINYWKQKLEHLPSALQLPTDRIRPTDVQTYQGDRAARMLPKALNHALNTLSQTMGSTLFMVLLSAFEVLLYRYSGQEDMLINFASAGRGQVETEGLIGFFSNTLLLRTNFSGNPTFRELLNRVRQESLEAYAHQDIPFEKLIEELRPEQNQSRSPLFQVKFALNPPWSDGRGMASVHLQEVTFTSLFGYIYHGKTKYDLTLVMREQDEGLGYVFDYNADLFDASTVNRMLDHFQNLLEGILANPDRRISDLPLLTPTELQHLFPDWHKSQKPWTKNTCVHEAFEAQAEKTPDAIALVYQDEMLTYKEVNGRANQLANYLQLLGVTPEMPVGIYLERSPDAIVSLIGILKVGAICVPLNPTDSPERLHSILENAQASVLLTNVAIAETISTSMSKVVYLDLEWDTIQQQSRTFISHNVTPESLAYILYTSRPTEQPLGVSILHRNIIQQIKSSDELNFSSTDIFLQCNSLSSEISLFEIWNGLLNGARLAISPSNGLSPKSLGQICQQYQVTIAWLPTRILHQIVNEQIESLKSLRQVLTSGDALSVSVVEKLRQLPECRLIYAYNLPENTGITCFNQIETIPSTNTAIPVGRAISNTQVYILDQHYQPVAIGILGEIYIGGEKIAQGYANHPDLTASKFITHSFDRESVTHLYKTGDLARYLPDGTIELVGCADTIPMAYGLRVETGRIETALSHLPNVQEALTTILPDSSGQEFLVAYVVPRTNQTVSVTELRSFLKQKVAAHMLPSAYIILDTLPLTSDGFIDYKALPLLDASSSVIETTFVAAQDDLELQLIKLWENTLGVQPIGITDNFFDLGGHSLLAVRLFAQIEETFGKNLPLSILLKASTIEHLAAVIRQDVATDIWSPLVELKQGTSRPPLFCVHGGGFNVLIYRDLALGLDPEQPVYGLQAQGLDGQKTTRGSSLEEIAYDYVKEIRTVQPHGPYHLAGLSHGGGIALEMAQQLHKEGERVAFLGMFDTYGPGGIKLLSPLPRLLSSLQYAFRYSVPRIFVAFRQDGLDAIFSRANKVVKALKKPSYQSISETSSPGAVSETDLKQNIENQNTSNPNEKRLEDQMNRVSRYILEHSPWAFFSPSAQLRESNNTISNTLKTLEESYSKIHKVYIPQPYPGRITIFRAMESPPGYQLERNLGWGKIAQDGVELYKIPGDHTSIMASPVLSEIMEACLKKAIDKQCSS